MTSKQDEEFDRKEELNDIRQIMAILPGRRFIGRILAEARIHQTSFAGQSNQTVFNEGQRNLGLFVLREITEACPELLIKMMQEGFEND